MKTGLVSVSFRNLTVEQIIAAVKDAGLDGIEWGGDVHVPHGDVEKAAYVAKLMKEAGLETLSYGSYFWVSKTPVEEFQGVIDCALALGTKVIRVWGGTMSPDKMTEECRAQVIAETKTISDMAKEHGLTVAYECHPDTITETLDSAMLAVKEVNKENMGMYWQPTAVLTTEENLHVLTQVLPHAHNLHVFVWDKDFKRYTLAEGEDVWTKYINTAKTNPQIKAAMLEFIKENSLEQLKKDAAVLNKMVKG